MVRIVPYRVADGSRPASAPTALEPPLNLPLRKILLANSLTPLAKGGRGDFPLPDRTGQNRLLPILSNSIVTRPLTDDERDACNFRTTQVLTDTRVLRHYYRQLPDGRVQIGSRSAITGRDAPRKQYEQSLIDDLQRKFPALRGIEIDYSWWSWVDVSHDMLPRIVQPDSRQAIYYALGYGGNGVMYSAQAGRRMVQRIAGQSEGLNAPIFTSPLPFPNVLDVRFEAQALAPFRRVGQRLLYKWYHLKDEVL